MKTPTEAVDRKIRSLQRRMFEDYADSVELDPEARYYNGTPLRPVVPLDTAVGGVFVLGAYPSSRFMVERPEGGSTLNNVPGGDNLGPFEEERWFDGRRMRVQPSATELRMLFLEPMGVSPSRCWITDLVKVFLFKEGHARAYRELGVEPPRGYERHRFDELGALSVDQWITKELEVARPKLVITLGAEVAGIVRGVDGAQKRTRLLQPRVEDVDFGGVKWPTIHCAHPGILMRKGDVRNRWPEKHREEFVPELVRFVGEVGIEAPDRGSL